MKKILLSAVALISLTASAQIYSANDSTAFSAWTTIDLDGDGANFAAVGNVNGSFAVSYSYDNGAGAALTPDNLFVSPALDLSTGSNLMLNFDVTAVDQAWLSEKYAVYVVTDLVAISGGSFPTPVQEEVIPTTGVLTRNIDISAEADGQSTAYIVIRHFDCTDFFAIGFAALSVTGDFATIEEEASLETVSAYPNPATDVLNIKLNSNIETVSILTIDGKVLSTEVVNSNNVTLDVNELTAGVYFYEVVSSEGIKTTNKFVKK